MNFLRSRLLQAVLILVIAYAIFMFAIRPAAPRSVLAIYMGVVILATFVYISSDSDAWRDFLRPMRDTLVRPERRLVRMAVVIAIPLLLGYYAYTQAAAKPQA